MPIIKREFYLSPERHEYFVKLPQSKRDLLWDSLQHELDRYVDNHRRGRQADPTRPPSYQINLVQQTEYVANNLLRVANKFGWSVQRTTRNAICDFLGLPADHIDRQERKAEYTTHEVFTCITVISYDRDTIRNHFNGTKAKQQFRAYFEQWCRKHLGE